MSPVTTYDNPGIGTSARLLLVCLLLAESFGSSRAAAAADFQIDVTAEESASGLDMALKAARQHRHLHPEDVIIVNLPAHLARTSPLYLGPEDSGADDAPLILRGAQDGGTIITGALTIAPEALADTIAEPISRMPHAIRDRVRRFAIGRESARLKPAFEAHSSFKPTSPGRLFVYDGNRRLEAAHWPSGGHFAAPTVDPAGPSGSLTLRLPEDIVGLDREADLWVTGFWGWNWWSETQKVESVHGRVITFSKPEAPVRSGARYSLFNVASGLSQAGLYYFDARNESLYLIPAEANRSGNVTVAVADSLVRITGAENVRFENIAFEKTIGAAVTMEHARNIVLSDCFIGHTGTDGVVINGGYNNRVERCVIDDVGYTAISIAGGDIKTLAPGGHVVRDSSISRFGRELPSYRPGVRLQGVGIRIEGCEIFDGPHSGIIFSGNDHQIIGNVLHDLVLDTNDAGAIYSGRNWTARGTLITSNFIYDVNNRLDTSNVMGIYLDDQLSGTVVIGNVFRNVDEPILVGGGRDNLIEDNLFGFSKVGPIMLDSRGLTWQTDMARPGGVLWEGLETVPYREAPYADRYPNLATILEDEPGAPLHNSFVDNVAPTSPVVAYDIARTASLGADTGNRMIGEAAAKDFPASLDGVPIDAPALPRLKATQTLVTKTIETMKTLRFRDQASR